MTIPIVKKTTLAAAFVICSLVNSISYAKEPAHYDKGKKTFANKAHHHVASLKSLLSTFLPRERIEVSSIKGSIILTGVVSSVEIADKAEKIAKEYHGHDVKLLNFIKIRGSQQVMLKVRVGEVKKDAIRSNSSNFDSLEQHGLINTLAEPNLVAMSGERAEFLAGGEIPVPTVQKEGNVAIDYKTYGVKLGFSPLVIAPNRIRLNIEQELSELSTDSAVMVSGFKIPSIASRRAKTTVELAPGESFMIAGLVKEDFIGHKGKDTELVISVTPYLVDPMHNKDVRLPTDSLHNPTKLEKSFIEKLSFTNKHTVAKKSNVSGPVGFIAE